MNHFQKLLLLLLSIVALGSCVLDNEKAKAEDELYANSGYLYSNNFIVYAKYDSSSFSQDIFKIAPDGTLESNITKSGFANEGSPVTSPDRKRVAFINGDELHYSDLQGEEDYKVSTLSTGTTPTWHYQSLYFCLPFFLAQDERKIFYLHSFYSGATGTKQEGYGSAFKNKDGHTASYPVFAKTEDRIAYISSPYNTSNDSYTLVVCSPDGYEPQGTPPREVFTSEWNLFSPQFSPDDRYIAFATATFLFSNNDIGIVDLSGGDGEFTNLTNGLGNNLSPSFSPDGTQIAFLSNRGGDYDIYIMNSNGSNVINITNTPDVDERAPFWY